MKIAGAMAVLACAAQVSLAAEWNLVWSEEFDYSGLPDPAKWGYEQGWVRNNESQYYMKERLENARVEDGQLILEGRKERLPNPGYDPAAKEGSKSREFIEYTAASITTRDKASWLYGRIEVRAKLPQGKGMWPAVWMLGTNIREVGWPRCGEIDIMEYVGKEPDAVHGTLHWGKSWQKPEKKSSGKKLDTPRPFDDFHIYAVEWYPDRIDFYFDDKKYHTVTAQQVIETSGENPFDKPHYLLLNLALGGSWGGEIDDSVLPQKYVIDYVRVYEQKAAEKPKP